MKFTYLVFAALLLPAVGKPGGKQLFEINCKACHALNQNVVGPSMVEIRKLYEKDVEGFVKWSLNPGKKRKDAIQMPAMTHVGEKGLIEIHKYINQKAKGVDEQVIRTGDPFANAPTQTQRPQVQRIFMPNAGPAAIAIALDENVSLCWDAGDCRLRYAWTGGFIDGYPYWKGNGSRLAEIKGDLRYTEERSPFSNPLKPKFKGYKMQGGLPTFTYQLGRRTFTERFEPLPNGAGFTRSFTITPRLRNEMLLTFPAASKIQITSEQAKVSEHVVTVPAANTSNFTLTFTF